MPKRVNIGPKTMDCMFIGYAKSSKACRFLVHKSEHPDINENTVIESNNTEFFENIYPYKIRHEQSSKGSKRPRDEPSENVHYKDNPRCSTHQRTSTSFGSDFVTFLLENEPQIFKEAMSSSDSSFWKEAINSKIDSILSNHTWELVDFPPGNKPLGSKWIFKRKIKADDDILIIGRDISDINAMKQMLERKFDMKDLGVADVILADEDSKWLRNFLEDIPYWPKPVAPVCIHYDSQAAIGKAGSMMYNGKPHHMRWRYNIVRELLSSGIIIVDYVKSKDNVSDPLTKGLSREGVERTSKGISLRPRTSQHGGNST
ncbi:hypothetical protein T459_16427 [Capsicum annuum]|uniref:Retroviral polymerase SH3-like domain-containing protein n=1 Tax=Capsicum annuum TaxID=4072 RepID=A0A2G2Z928_CAPAN|nr:hypothetical protein FXO37_12766 [Capsicum annuum]PHT78375.1 hypothetical protein T459_16427 [Capsicum annuum]